MSTVQNRNDKWPSIRITVIFIIIKHQYINDSVTAVLKSNSGENPSEWAVHKYSSLGHQSSTFSTDMMPRKAAWATAQAYSLSTTTQLLTQQCKLTRTWSWSFAFMWHCKHWSARPKRARSASLNNGSLAASRCVRVSYPACCSLSLSVACVRRFPQR